MSRLHQALERSRKIEGRSEDPALACDPIDEPWAVTAQVAIPRIENPRTEVRRDDRARPTSDVNAIQCPTCAKVREDSPHGPWVIRFYNLLGIPPYRCRSCRRRFFPEDREDRESHEKLTFLSPADPQSFQDLVRDLARDERTKVLARKQTHRTSMTGD